MTKITGSIVQCYCPHCKKSLTSNDNQIDGQPTVHLLTYYEGAQVDIFLSAVWGKFKRIFVGKKIPKGTILKILCPECEKDLGIDFPKCSCEAPLAILKCKDGILGSAYICTRTGCYHHKMQPDRIPGSTPTGA